MAGNILYIAFIIVLFRGQTYRAAAEVQDEDNPLSWLMQQCVKNGDSVRATTAMQNFQLCIVNAKIRLSLSLPSNTGGKMEGIEALLTLCDKTEALLMCFKQLTYDVKPCFTAEDDLEIAYVLAQRVANFICVEKTSMIREFIANDGYLCYDEKKKEKKLEKCLKVGELEGISIANDHHILNIGKKDCALLSEYQTCMVQQLRSCPEPTVDLVSSLIADTMLEGLSCNRALSFEMSLGRFVLMCATAIVAVTAISFK